MTGYVLCVLVTAVAVTIAALAIARRRALARNLRIRNLIDYVDHLHAGAGERLPTDYNTDEIGILARSLAAAARAMQENLSRMKIDASRVDAILSSMSEGVLVVDRDLRVLFANDALQRAVQARRRVSDGSWLLELLRDSEVHSMLVDVIRSGASSKRSLRVGAASGRSFEIYAAPLEAGPEGGAIAIFHDITDLERLEQVRKDFVANVSHEIRTPLASVIAYSDTLLEGALDDVQVNRRFVEVIRSNAVRLQHIAADLLTLSDLESGSSPGEPERIPVRDVLEATLNTMDAEARVKDVSIVRAGLQDVFVMGHRLRLEQALFNVVANAVKFNRPGGQVKASLSQTGDSVRIEVSDTGIGIPSEDLPRIFERFYRVDKGRSREVGGTGLGLSIVKHVVEGMSGNIKVESQLGKGTTFTITLPGAADVIVL